MGLTHGYNFCIWICFITNPIKEKAKSLCRGKEKRREKEDGGERENERVYGIKKKGKSKNKKIYIYFNDI
jgi:hypothetical protein